MAHINNDFQFDAWMKRYSAKMNQKAKGSNATSVTKDQYRTRTKGMLPNPGG